MKLDRAPRGVRVLGRAALALALAALAIGMSVALTALWVAATAQVSGSARGWLVTGLWAVTFIPAFLLATWATCTGRAKQLWALGFGFAAAPLVLLVLLGSWEAQVAIPLLGARAGSGSSAALPASGVALVSWATSLVLLAAGTWHFAKPPRGLVGTDPAPAQQPAPAPETLLPAPGYSVQSRPPSGLRPTQATADSPSDSSAFPASPGVG